MFSPLPVSSFLLKLLAKEDWDYLLYSTWSAVGRQDASNHSAFKVFKTLQKQMELNNSKANNNVLGEHSCLTPLQSNLSIRGYIFRVIEVPL